MGSEREDLVWVVSTVPQGPGDTFSSFVRPAVFTAIGPLACSALWCWGLRVCTHRHSLFCSLSPHGLMASKENSKEIQTATGVLLGDRP